MRVLGISGSLRRDSFNTALLRAAAERLPAGAELVEFERLREIPPYDEDVEAVAPVSEIGLGGGAAPGVDAVHELREEISTADAVLIATPEYNHSIPGQLKNALDWASRPAGKSALNGKPAAAIGASRSMFGGVWAQAELRKVLAAMGGRVIEAELPVAHAHELMANGRLELPPEQSERLEEILAELVAAAEQEAGLTAAAA
jgi:chromate reductase